MSGVGRRRSGDLVAGDGPEVFAGGIGSSAGLGVQSSGMVAGDIEIENDLILRPGSPLSVVRPILPQGGKDLDANRIHGRLFGRRNHSIADVLVFVHGVGTHTSEQRIAALPGFCLEESLNVLHCSAMERGGRCVFGLLLREGGQGSAE